MKSLVIFTDFWDANDLIENKVFITNVGESYYKISLEDNYSLYSIALMTPEISDKKLKNLTSIRRIDCFCPTYEILKKYHNDKDWNSYKEHYTNIIKNRKDTIKDWIKNLKKEHIYILCCWENTSKGSHCHREILYDAFQKSNTVKDVIIPIYRHGSESKKVKIEEVTMPSSQEIIYPVYGSRRPSTLDIVNIFRNL